MPTKKHSERVPEGVSEGLANFLINRQAAEIGAKQQDLLMSDSVVVPRRGEGWRTLLINRAEETPSRSLM